LRRISRSSSRADRVAGDATIAAELDVVFSFLDLYY
jgi:hypothetical protein